MILRECMKFLACESYMLCVRYPLLSGDMQVIKSVFDIRWYIVYELYHIRFSSNNFMKFHVY